MAFLKEVTKPIYYVTGRTKYGFKRQVKSKLPNLQLSIKTLIGHVLAAESKQSGKGYASIHLDKNWYGYSSRYKTKHS